MSQTSETTRKRKKETVSLACLHCRKRHVKCDGQQPKCGRCVSRNLECVFEKSSKKRGPEAGKLAKIRKGVSIIQEELIKTKLECAEWQRRYQSLICETYVQIFFQSTQIRDSQYVILSVHFADYLHNYNFYFLPFMRIQSPYSDLTSFMYDQEADPTKILLMNGILAMGAITSGNLNHGNLFIQTTKRILSTMYDMIHPLIAATHFILARAYSAMGEFDKSGFYNSMAQTMVHSLLKKLRTTTVHNIDLQHMNQLCTLTSLFDDQVRQLNFYEETINAIMKSINSGKPNDVDIFPYLAAILIGRVWTGIYVEIEKYLGNQQRIENPKLFLATFQRLLAILNQAHECIQCSAFDASSKRQYEMTIEGTKAWLLMFCNQHEQAVNCCKEVMARYEDAFKTLPFSIPPIFMATCVYLYLQNWPEYQRLVKLLESFLEYQPLASVCLQVLKTVERQHQERTLDLFTFVITFRNLLWSSDGTLLISQEDTKNVFQHFTFSPNFGNTVTNNLTNNNNNSNVHSNYCLPNTIDTQKIVILETDVNHEKSDSVQDEEHQHHLKRRRTELLNFFLSEQGKKAFQQYDVEDIPDITVLNNYTTNTNAITNININKETHHEEFGTEEKQHNAEQFVMEPLRSNLSNKTTLQYFETSITPPQNTAVASPESDLMIDYNSRNNVVDNFETSEKLFADLLTNDENDMTESLYGKVQ